MKIIDKIYKQVIERCSSYQMETGGIIGGKNEIVCEFFFDIGHKGEGTGCYIPRVDFLNYCIADWQQKEIQFYGIFHSHYQHSELSCGDIRYINRIMSAMPTKIIRLYFPIVYPLDSKIISFMAIRDGDTIKIANDVINVVQEE